MTAPAETANQYRAEQIAAAAAAAAAAYQAASLAGYSLSNFTAWSRLIRLLFDVVSRQRVNAAFSARRFFDLERQLRTGLPQLDVPLVGYDFQRFEKAMRPAYDMVVKQLAVVRELEKQGLPQPKPRTAPTVAVLASREVSQAGREQLLAAVKADNAVLLDDPEREPVGWARVATGNETCAWCLMLVSRGPSYRYADTAGAKLTDAEVLNSGGLMVDDMEKWHAGCDCLVVPVFDRSDWPGRDAYKEALKQWNAAVPDKIDPDKKYRVRQKDGTYKMVTLKQGEARSREALINIRQELVRP